MQSLPSETFLIGVDLGTAFSKIGAPGTRQVFDIVTNPYSERKTISSISFANARREFGPKTKEHTITNPMDVYTVLPSFLGFNASDLSVHPALAGPLSSLNISQDMERGTPLFHLSNNRGTFGSEELLAHFIDFLSTMSKEMRGINPNETVDAIFTVPESFGMRKRQALLQAAEIAKVNVLGVVRETSAAALYHASALPSSYNGTKLFLNMGAWRTQACIVRYGKNLLTRKSDRTGTDKASGVPDTVVRACAESDQVGGMHFDFLLARHLAQSAEKRFGAEIWNSTRAMQKLYGQAEKTKIVLSSNQHARVHIDPLYNGEPFSARVARDDFKDLIAPLLPHAKAVVMDVLDQLNLTTEALSGVEMVGGGWRVPSVQAALERVVAPLALGQHVNADEAMALGATLAAVNASATLRLRPTYLHDGAARSYSVIYRNISDSQAESKSGSGFWRTKRDTADTTSRTRSLVVAGDRMAGYRTLTLRTCHDIETFLIETTPYAQLKKSTRLEHSVVRGIAEHCQGKYKNFGKPRVLVVFALNPFGIVQLHHAIAQWEETYSETVTITTTTTTPRTEKQTTTTTASTGHKEDSTNNTTATTSTTTTTTSSTTTTPSRVTTSSAPPQTKVVQKTRKHTVRCTITTTSSEPRPLTPENIEDAMQRLEKFKAIDEEARHRAHIKNELESYLLDMRSRLSSNQLSAVAEKSNLDALETTLMEVEEWLFSDDVQEGDSQPIETYQKKLDMLITISQPYLFRHREIQERKILEGLVARFQQTIASVMTPEAQAKLDYNATHVKLLEDQWKAFEGWYAEKRKAQEGRSLKEDPAYNTTQVKEQLHGIKQVFEVVVKTARPHTTSTTAPPAPSAPAPLTALNATSEDSIPTGFSNMTTPDKAVEPTGTSNATLSTAASPSPPLDNTASPTNNDTKPPGSDEL